MALAPGSCQGGPSGKGAAGPRIAATMTGMEAITFVLAAALAVGTIAFRAFVSPRAAVALLTVAALGFLLALLHWGKWLPWQRRCPRRPVATASIGSGRPARAAVLACALRQRARRAWSRQRWWRRAWR